MADQHPIPDPTLTVSALIAANRLEARPRSDEFNRALWAEIRDPLWLLARQWQMGEYRAEDRGTPSFAEVEVQELPLSRIALPGQAARTYDRSNQPLEAAVEAQPRPIGPGLRLQMGQYWLRQLRTIPAFQAATATEQVAAIGVFSRLYRLVVPSTTEPVAYAQATTTVEAHELVQLAGPAAFDGYLFYQALLAPHAQALAASYADSDQLAQALRTLPLVEVISASPAIANATDPALVAGLNVLGRIDLTTFNVQVRHFILAFHRLYLLGADSTSWSTETMAYSFALGTAGGIGLGTTHYPGGGTLPWYAVDQQAALAGSPPTPVVPARKRLLATGVRFPGAPNARWWEFEDQRVDFGQVSGDPSDWGRMLLQEFVFLYQDDWFSVPYSLERGGISTVQSLRVTDVFGQRYAIQPAGAGQLQEATGNLVDNDANLWRLFAQTDGSSTDLETRPRLYLPATALAPMVSQPIEQVSFRREEATNLVWAVESIIPDGFTSGLNGGTAANQVTENLRQLAPKVTPASGSNTAPDYTYQLATTIPENWLPFVPVADAAGAVVLTQGVLERQVPGLTLVGDDATVQPRTALLRLHPNTPYQLHEHEVPATGVRVEARCYRARWYGGRTVVWLGRLQGPAQTTGSSGLAFDVLLPSR